LSPDRHALSSGAFSGRFVSGLKIPFPGNGDLSSERLGSNACFSDPEDEHFRSVLTPDDRVLPLWAEFKHMLIEAAPNLKA
jgi:hypothetical protein